jgi:hypothetical protein
MPVFDINATKEEIDEIFLNEYDVDVEAKTMSFTFVWPDDMHYPEKYDEFAEKLNQLAESYGFHNIR